MPDVTFNVVTKPEIQFDGLPNLIAHSGISDVALAELYRSSDMLLPLIQ